MGEGVIVGVRVSVGDEVGVGVRVTVEVRVTVGVAEGVNVSVGEGVSVSMGAGVEVATRRSGAAWVGAAVGAVQAESSRTIIKNKGVGWERGCIGLLCGPS